MNTEIIPGRKTDGSTVSSINCDRSSVIYSHICAEMEVKLQLTNYDVEEEVYWHFAAKGWTSTITITRTWANIQRDGRPAEYTWRPLLNATKFG